MINQTLQMFSFTNPSLAKQSQLFGYALNHYRYRSDQSMPDVNTDTGDQSMPSVNMNSSASDTSTTSPSTSNGNVNGISEAGRNLDSERGAIANLLNEIIHKWNSKISSDRLNKRKRKRLGVADSGLQIEKLIEILLSNRRERRGDLCDGQRISDVGNDVKTARDIKNKGAEFSLIQNTEKEAGAKKEESPSAFNEIREYQSNNIQDGRGVKKPKDKAQSPLDQFSIVPFFPLPIGRLYFSFTNASFFLLLTLIFVLFSFHLVTKKGGGKLVPNACQSVLELIYDFVPNLVNEQIGGLSGNVKQQFFPCISVTFTFSLFRNLQGMIPYSFTVTSHFIVTLGLSFSLFIGITIVGFSKNGLHFLSFSLPAGVPLPLAPFLVLLELIPHCFRALSLGIRLFANMMAGHSLVKILSGFAWTMLCMNDLFYFIGSTGPFFIVLALTGLELGVAILQAYVFTILICIYLNDAINLH